MKRRNFCTRITAAAAGAGALVIARSLAAMEPEGSQASADVAEIYRLQAAFHHAKTAQDLPLMVSLWDAQARLEIVGDAKSPYVGTERLHEFWANSGSFKNRRFSLVPSYKTQIEVHGDQGTLYFECHDVADYDQPSRNIINDTFLRGTVRKVEGKWKFAQMTAGPSTPLSLDHYYG
jgi:hypothetical protein